MAVRDGLPGRSSRTFDAADGSPFLRVDEARAMHGFVRVLVRILWQPPTKTLCLESCGRIGFHQPSTRSSPVAVGIANLLLCQASASTPQ